MDLGYILLIDDDIANYVNKLVIQNTKKGIYTVSFLTASEGLNYLNDCFSKGDELPQYIFLDINMPEMNGWEFLEEYATLNLKIKDHIKIMMLSSSQNEADITRALSNPYVSGFIHKPLDGEYLSALIK